MRTTGPALLALAWVAIFLLPAPARAGLPFTLDVAGSSVGTVACPSIALDSLGEPRVAFHSLSGRDLRYASWDGGTWSVEPVDTLGDQGYCSSLALDAAGNPHIAYWDRSLLRLRYAWKESEAWHYETVDSGWGGIDVALRLDALDRPHITYAAPLTFWYAERGPAGWTRTLVDPSVQGYESDLAIDSSGRVHIVYQDELRGDLHYALKNGALWSYELVDSTDVVGKGCRLALDAAGTPYVAYFDWSNTLVRVAVRSGGGWIVERTGLAGGEPSIALDPAGSPHFAYYRADGHLGYGTRTAGIWTAEVVDSSNFNGLGCDLAFDGDGNPYIAYEHQEAPGLHLADTALHLLSPVGGERWTAGSYQTIRWRGAGSVSIQLSPDGGATYPARYLSTSATSRVIGLPLWSTDAARCRIVRADPPSSSVSRIFAIAIDSTAATPFVVSTVDSLGDPGEYASLVLDGRGEPAIAYRDAATATLRYAERQGRAWHVEAVDPAAGSGLYASLAMDATGGVHVAYELPGVPAPLRYASRLGGRWSIEPVPVAGQPAFGSLALDPHGVPFIAYWESGSRSICVVERRDGSWRSEVVAPGWGYGPSLAIDQEGNPHLAFHDGITGTARYAVRRQGAWSTETIDPAYLTGWPAPSLVLGPGGTPRVAYYDPGNTTLRYAERSAVGWISQAVSGVLFFPEVGIDSRPSLALDPAGTPAIAWYSNVTGVLRFARPGPGGWRIETVDSAGAGGYASLKFDSEGNPRIAYRHAGRKALRYADAAIHVIRPAGGERWEPGSTQIVEWSGLGTVDVSLSPDGGATWVPAVSAAPGGSATLAVPAWWTADARVRLARRRPPSTSESAVFSIAPESGPRFALRPPFPNPSVGRGPVTFPLSLPRGGAVSLELYDVQGRLVRRRPWQAFSVGGLYPIPWDPGPIPSGIYLVRATDTSGRSAHAKWIRLR